jgi:Lrp/AsnC family transcriptional regulator for asnA, asnC and gidA
MDELDSQIIVELQRDLRLHNTRLAKILGVSEATIRRRINNLVSSGTISLTAIPDPIKVGYTVQAFIGLRTDPPKIESIAKKLAECSEVRYVDICSGNYDILIWVVGRSIEDLKNFIVRELAQFEGVINTETMIQLEYLKRSFAVKEQ